MNILIVDDSPNIRNNLKKFLSEVNNVSIVGEADNSGFAVELINKTKPDLIILDVELKNGSGFDVLEYISQNQQPAKMVVLMFTNHSETYKEKALKLKVDHFFDKTNELDLLLSTVKGIVNYE